MDVKIIEEIGLPNGLYDDVIKSHLLVDEVTCLISTYRDAAIDYVERYTNVPLVDKVVEQSYTSVDKAECVDTSVTPYTYTFNLKYRTDDDEPIISAKYGDEIEIPIEDIQVDNWKTINQITIANLPTDAKNIRVQYNVKCTRIPPGLISAVLILIAEYYEQRSVVESKRILNIRQVMQPYRIYM